MPNPPARRENVKATGDTTARNPEVPGAGIQDQKRVPRRAV
jgi:hypothetical protein